MNVDKLIAANLDLIVLMSRTELIKWAFLHGEISQLREINAELKDKRETADV